MWRGWVRVKGRVFDICLFLFLFCFFNCLVVYSMHCCHFLCSLYTGVILPQKDHNHSIVQSQAMWRAISPCNLMALYTYTFSLYDVVPSLSQFYVCNINDYSRVFFLSELFNERFIEMKWKWVTDFLEQTKKNVKITLLRIFSNYWVQRLPGSLGWW